MKPAFTDAVFGAQEIFRALMEAMARPGRIQSCDVLPDCPAGLAPAAAAALLALADSETPVWTDADEEARQWIAFHTGATLLDDPARAQFLLVTRIMPRLSLLDAGTDEAPHESATLIIQPAALATDHGWRLTGPGIEHAAHIHAQGLPADFLAQWAGNRAIFPRGVDLVLAHGQAFVALPRTTAIAATPHPGDEGENG